MKSLKFLELDGKAYIYDTNQNRMFEMGCEASLDVTDEFAEVILKNGVEVNKEKAWEISGLNELNPV